MAFFLQIIDTKFDRIYEIIHGLYILIIFNNPVFEIEANNMHVELSILVVQSALNQTY